MTSYYFAAQPPMTLVFFPRQCCVGTELVDWQMQQSACVHSRLHAVGMWQVLLEEGVLNHGEALWGIWVCPHECPEQRV